MMTNDTAAKVLRVMQRDELTQWLLTRIVQAGLPEPVREWMFHPVRRWRFDLSWPPRLLAIELDGGTWNGGRHTTGIGFRDDCFKTNEAQIMGWVVLRFTSDMVRDDSAIDTLVRAWRQTQ